MVFAAYLYPLLRRQPPLVVTPAMDFGCHLPAAPFHGGVTVIGDIHGDYRALVELLRSASLVAPAPANESAGTLRRAAASAIQGDTAAAAAPCSAWIAPADHIFVQLGDVVDRGPETGKTCCLSAFTD